MANRTKLDIIINEFLLSKLNAKQFISNNLSELNTVFDKRERITSLIDYLKNNNQEAILSFFYEEQLANISIKQNEIIFNRFSVHEKLNYIELLREDAFEQRIKELKILQEVELPEYLEIYQENKVPKEKSLEDGHVLGLNFTPKNNSTDYLSELYNYLIDHGFINEMDKRIFKKMFKKSYLLDKDRIIWRKAEYSLAIFIHMMNDANLFKIEKNNFWSIIDYTFMKNDGITKFTGTKLRDNTYKPNKITNDKKFTEIENLKTFILNHLS